MLGSADYLANFSFHRLFGRLLNIWTFPLWFLWFDRKFGLPPVQSNEVTERQDDMNLIFHIVLCLYQYDFITDKLVFDPKLVKLLAGKYPGCTCFSRKLQEKSWCGPCGWLRTTLSHFLTEELCSIDSFFCPFRCPFGRSFGPSLGQFVPMSCSSIQSSIFG